MASDDSDNVETAPSHRKKRRHSLLSEDESATSHPNNKKKLRCSKVPINRIKNICKLVNQIPTRKEISKLFHRYKNEGFTSTRFSWMDLRIDCLAEHYRQRIGNCWAVALYRQWYALMRLAGRDMTERLLSPSRIKRGVPCRFRTSNGGIIENLYAFPFMLQHVKKITLHRKPHQSQYQQDFEILLERLLGQGPFTAAITEFPSYEEADYMGVLCPTRIELETSKYRRLDHHCLLAYGAGVDASGEKHKPYWHLYESQGCKFAEFGFTRLERYRGLIDEAVEMVLKDEKQIEAPEVELARRAVEDNCLGKNIVDVNYDTDTDTDDTDVGEISPVLFSTRIHGKQIERIHRKGIHMWFQLDSPPHLCLEFGLESAFHIKGVVNESDDNWPPALPKFTIKFEDDEEISFTDPKGLAVIRFLVEPTSVLPISKLGPDALLEPLTVDSFLKRLSKKKRAIKPLLLDQSFISGIGNWIADEALYKAKIHPLQPACSLSRKLCKKLLNYIKEVLETVIDVGADSRRFPRKWIFHSREEEVREGFVDGNIVDFLAAEGWTTAYAPEIQKLL